MIAGARLQAMLLLKSTQENGLLRHTALLMAVVTALLFAAACGGSNADSPTSTQQQAISIEFQPAPVNSISLNSNAQITAVVQNDTNNYGVDWCLAGDGNACGATCDVNVCGHFASSGGSAAHSSSGEAVTYYPPTNLTGNKTTINIIAFATADHSKNITAPLQIVGYSGNLAGTFVLEVKGSALNARTLLPEAYEFAGVVALDGNGGISLAAVNGEQVGGEFTYSTPGGQGSGYITGGSYSLGSDGRGTLTVITTNTNVGVKGTATFDLVFLSSSQALIAEADANASASGSMDLQTKVAIPSGGFAFVSSGADGSGNAAAFGGVMNIDMPGGGISGNGSLADAVYSGTTQNCVSPTGLTGTVLTPDQFGTVQIQLNTCFSTTPVQLTAYVVDSSHFKFVESDLNSSAGTGLATSGFAMGQGSSTGALAGNSLASTYVFGLLGTDSSGLPNSLTSVALFNPSATGSFSGMGDEFATTLAITDNFSGTYTLDGTGTGRVDSLLTFANASNARFSTPELFFYLTGANKPAVVLSADMTAATSAIGVAYPQAQTPLTFNGNYGIGATNVTPESEFDLTGQMTASGGSSSMAGALDGSGGYGGGSPFDSVPLTGTFQTPPSNGRFSGQLLASDSGGSSLTVSTEIEFYLIDAKHGFMIETDTNAELLGYFGPRNPVCSGCP